MNKLLFFALAWVTFGYALEYVNTMQIQPPYYSPTSMMYPDQRIGQVRQQPMLNDYGLPMGVPQASRPFTHMETDVEIGKLELARQQPIIRPTS